MEDAIRIKMWGVRGSTPCPNTENMEYGGNTTCISINPGNSEKWLILDCGTGIRNLGNHLQQGNGPVEGRIFITHPHWDHLQGFPFFKPFYNPDNHFRIFIPPQGDIGCKDILQGHMSSTFFPVSIDMLEADIDCTTYKQEKLNFEDYSVEYFWANHTVPTAAYKISMGGRVIIFAPDNELLTDQSPRSGTFRHSFSEFLQGADILIHDGQYNDEQYKERKGWGHSSWEQVIPLAEKAGVKQLYITHHDPDHSDEYLAEVDQQIKSQFGDSFAEISLAREGQEILLPAVTAADTGG